MGLSVKQDLNALAETISNISATTPSTLLQQSQLFHANECHPHRPSFFEEIDAIGIIIIVAGFGSD